MSNRSIVIIGDEYRDPTGLLFEAELKVRGVKPVWLSLEEVMRSLHGDGGSLLDMAQRGPIGEELDPASFQVEHSDLLVAGTGVLDVADARDHRRLVVAAVLEAHGLVQCNTSKALYLAMDKWRSCLRVTAAGVPVPSTMLVRTEAELATAIDRLGVPLVLKEPMSSQGAGVRRAASKGEALRSADELGLAFQPLLLQHYVECDAKDIRIVVVNGEVVDAHQRAAVAADEFRSNVSLGGKATRVPCPEGAQRIALLAAEVLDLNVAGMDVTRVTETVPGRENLPEGSLFWIEANGTPAFRPGDYSPAKVVEFLLERMEGS